MVELALFGDPRSGSLQTLRDPVEVVSVDRVDQVVEGLRRVETAVEHRGLIAAGMIAYEAAPAFDPALRVSDDPPAAPLLHFGLFEPSSGVAESIVCQTGDTRIGEWTASQSEEAYRESVQRIRNHIARGDTYQVNHTMRLRASFEGDPLSLFFDLVRAQPDSYACYLDLGDLVICSVSPELFFDFDGETIVSRPMKGTAGRGHDLDSDRRQKSWLRASAKNRAENAMIVDMVRNDLGRIARVGTIKVASRFDVERHPTVFQMTSTVEAKTAASISEIMASLFPFASVTGAPKVRTMELIRELEDGPRGVYTGAVGVILPGRRARFSVGIRTAVVKRSERAIEYGVGSGIVWDSTADEEYRECLAKAKVLSLPPPEFDLLETILWDPSDGYALLERHLDRLAGAAEYFDRPFDREGVVEGLRTVPGTELRSCCGNSVTPYLAPTRSAPIRSLRVRVLVAADGSHRVETTPMGPESEAPPVRLGLAGTAVNPDDPFLHFKTTHREVYDRARQSRPDCDDVLLWNARGEVTESTIANLVARIGGELVTPPVSSGLLAGTFRADLLERGEIVERVIRVDELRSADALYLINSVQGWREVEWAGGEAD